MDFYLAMFLFLPGVLVFCVLGTIFNYAKVKRQEMKKAKMEENEEKRKEAWGNMVEAIVAMIIILMIVMFCVDIVASPISYM